MAAWCGHTLTQASGTDNPLVSATDFYWRSVRTMLGDLHKKGLGTADPQNGPMGNRGVA